MSWKAILEHQGYRKGNLSNKICIAISEGNLPGSVQGALHTGRAFGNFSVHPPGNHSLVATTDAEKREADWFLDLIERLIDYYYTNPAQEDAIAAKNASMANRAKELKEARKPASE